MINKYAHFIVFFTVSMFFISAGFCEGVENKEDLARYLKELASIMTNADITIRSVGSNILPMQEGAKRMDTYISQLGLINYPIAMSKQYKMVLLSFKKIRTGLLLFSLERKDLAVGLIKNGIRLLKYAAKDILAIAEKEGIKKIKDKPAEKGE